MINRLGKPLFAICCILCALTLLFPLIMICLFCAGDNLSAKAIYDVNNINNLCSVIDSDSTVIIIKYSSEDITNKVKIADFKDKYNDFVCDSSESSSTQSIGNCEPISIICVGEKYAFEASHYYSCPNSFYLLCMYKDEYVHRDDYWSVYSSSKRYTINSDDTYHLFSYFSLI